MADATLWCWGVLVGVTVWHATYGGIARRRIVELSTLVQQQEDEVNNARAAARAADLSRQSAEVVIEVLTQRVEHLEAPPPQRRIVALFSGPFPEA